MNFRCFRENRANIQGVSTDKVTRKYVHKFSRNSQIFVFCAYYINVAIKFDDFFLNSERKKKPIVNTIYRLEGAQYALLDHSKARFFFSNTRAHAPFVPIPSGPKKAM